MIRCIECGDYFEPDSMHQIYDYHVCNDCYWSTLWQSKDCHIFKKRKDPRQPVLDLIDRLQGEAGHASMGELYATIYSAFDVHEILNEIQQSVEDMEV